MGIQVHIKIVGPEGEVGWHPLDPGGVTVIGRGAANPIRLAGPEVARFHAVLHHQSQPCRIQALRKTGVRLGDRELRGHASAPLGSGDRFRIGAYTLTLVESTEPLPLPAPGKRLYRLSVADADAREPVSRPWSGRRLMGLALLVLIVLAVYVGQASRTEPDTPPRPTISIVTPSSPPLTARQPVVGVPTPSPEALSFEDMFHEIADQYGLDGRLLIEIAYKESEFNLQAKGARGELGLMQIHPATWRAWAPQVNVADPDDAYSNVLVAAAYLDHLRQDCESLGQSGTFCLLVSYNWGPGNLRQHLAGGGSLSDVPDWPRRYAQDLIRAAASEADPWREGLPDFEIVRPPQAGQDTSD